MTIHTPASTFHEDDLVRLGPDHPGFRDPIYRTRRNEIAALALAHRRGQAVPHVDYRVEETATWAGIWERLAPLQREFAAPALVEAIAHLGFTSEHIPQLEEVNARLAPLTGCRLEPVAGLVEARVFLSELSRRVLLSTQYLRHPSRPLYTPEPDLVHELVGHAGSLALEGVARVGSLLGAAAAAASESEMRRLERIYWWGLEFSVVREAGEVYAFGAGLLSSCAELASVRNGPELLPFDPERMAHTPYDPTDLQPRLFLAASTAQLFDGLCYWLARGRWRD